MALRYFKLVGKVAVECSYEESVQELRANHLVARTEASKEEAEISVSTIFMPFDHNFSNEGPPIIFETMIFGGEHDGYCDRYSTWEEAENGHKKAEQLAGIEDPT